MFAALTVLLVLNLLSFGGVLPEAWGAVTMLWFALTGVYLCYRTLRGHPLDLRFLVLALAALCVGLLAGPKFAIGVFAGVWAWRAGTERPDRIDRFLHALLVIGLLEGFLGITQRFLLPGWIFEYHNTVSAVSGTLVNRNHFAGLMGMLVFVPLGLAYAGTRDEEIPTPFLYVSASAFMALALVCSLSRMGVVSFFIALAFVVIVVRMRKADRKLGTIVVLGLFALVIAGALWIGVDALIARYATLIGRDAAAQEARSAVFRDTARMISNNPWGVGAGNYGFAFRPFQTTQLKSFFDHAHNDYLEMAAEWGVLICALFWSAVVLILARTVRIFLSSDSFRQRGIALTCMGAVVELIVHGLADFNLQIPVNAMLFFVFLGLAMAGRNERPRHLPDKHRVFSVVSN